MYIEYVFSIYNRALCYSVYRSTSCRIVQPAVGLWPSLLTLDRVDASITLLSLKRSVLVYQPERRQHLMTRVAAVEGKGVESGGEGRGYILCRLPSPGIVFRGEHLRAIVGVQAQIAAEVIEDEVFLLRAVNSLLGGEVALYTTSTIILCLHHDRANCE